MLRRVNKVLFLTAAVFLAVFLLSGCDNSKDNTEVKNQTNEQTEVKQDTLKELEPKKEDTKPITESTKEDQESSIYTERNNLIKQELINKYQAVDVSEIKNPKLSVEISRKFEHNNVFVEAKLQDVYTRSEKYFLKAEAPLIRPRLTNSARYVAELECTRDTADYIIENKGSLSRFGADLFIIAEIDNVSKPSYELSVSPISEEEAEIKLDENDIFVFKGRLIELKLTEKN